MTAPLNSTPQLPIDNFGHSLNALAFLPDSAQTLTIGSASARNNTAFLSGIRVITIYNTVDCFIRQGDSGVIAAATDHFIPAGTLLTLSTRPGQYIAVIQSSASGTLYVSELY